MDAGTSFMLETRRLSLFRREVMDVLPRPPPSKREASREEDESSDWYGQGHQEH